MRDSSLPARLTRSWRARLLAAALLLSVAPLAGCTGSSGGAASGAAAATARGTASPAPGPASASPATTTVPAGPPAAADSSCPLQQSPCYSPHQFRVAYGIQPLLDSGIDGRGVTVTVLAPAPSPSNPGTDIRQDLAAFNTMFGLPAARIRIVTALAGAAAPWQASGEEVGDFEMLHAVAPAAVLRVVLFPSSWIQSAANATADMLAGLRLAVSGTDVASISWGLGEHYFTKAQAAEMHSILAGAAARHVTVLASSGDNGAFSDDWFGGKEVEEVSLPASDPLVLGVGGTTLTAEPSGAYVSETAWAGGGGFSHLYARPAYQDGVPGISAMRGVPDVSADAGHPGPPIVFAGGIIETPEGTSGSTPLWGGVIALADQYAHHDLGLVNPAIYRIGRSPSYHRAFHDVTTGNDYLAPGSVILGYQAGPGWDPLTGWGSPDAQVLVPLLARFASSEA
jgi:subtilase family serine protease